MQVSPASTNTESIIISHHLDSSKCCLFRTLFILFRILLDTLREAVYSFRLLAQPVCATPCKPDASSDVGVFLINPISHSYRESHRSQPRFGPHLVCYGTVYERKGIDFLFCILNNTTFWVVCRWQTIQHTGHGCPRNFPDVSWASNFNRTSSHRFFYVSNIGVSQETMANTNER